MFDLLPNSDWFAKPFDEMQEVKICSKSGYRATENCEKKKMEFIQISGLKTKPCPHHILVHLDRNEQYQVNSSCEDLNNITHKSWFVLPPLMEYYYKSKNPFYKPLPQFRSNCLGDDNIAMQFIYPKENSTIFLPKDFDGKTNELILKIAHSKPETMVFWYVDEMFIGTTKDIHDMAIIPIAGFHKITVVDINGNETTCKITLSL